MHNELRKSFSFPKIFFIILGIFCASFGLKSFLLPNKFIDGGVTGISMLSSVLLKIPLPIFIILINLPFLYLAFSNISKELGIKAIIGIGGLALVLTFVPFPVITHDKLLIAVFGGVFLGLGIGFSIRGGGVLDGTEILAVYLSRKLHTTVGDIILITNILVFSFVAIFLGIEVAFYSILTYASTSKSADFIIEGLEEYIAVIIITRQVEEIRKKILYEIQRGVSIFKGERGFQQTEKEIDILYSVITRLELPKLSQIIREVDPSAFVVMHYVKDTIGGYIKKRPHSVL